MSRDGILTFETPYHFFSFSCNGFSSLIVQEESVALMLVVATGSLKPPALPWLKRTLLQGELNYLALFNTNLGTTPTQIYSNVM